MSHVGFVADARQQVSKGVDGSCEAESIAIISLDRRKRKAGHQITIQYRPARMKLKSHTSLDFVVSPKS